MKRIVLVLAVAALMAATLGASALPALAETKNQARHQEIKDECKGGQFPYYYGSKNKGDCVSLVNERY